MDSYDPRKELKLLCNPVNELGFAAHPCNHETCAKPMHNTPDVKTRRLAICRNPGHWPTHCSGLTPAFCTRMGLVHSHAGAFTASISLKPVSVDRPGDGELAVNLHRLASMQKPWPLTVRNRLVTQTFLVVHAREGSHPQRGTSAITPGSSGVLPIRIQLQESTGSQQ
jgi:hypothetical protein